MGRMYNTALWTSMDDFLQKWFPKDEEVIRLVSELRMGGRLNGGDILNLKGILKAARASGYKAATSKSEEEK